MSNQSITNYTPRGVMPLSDAMNLLFRDAFTAPFGAGAASTLAASMNLYEADDRYILQVPLAGVQVDQLSITARENMVSLQGTTELHAPGGARSLYTGTVRGQFREVVQLPSDIDAERADATYENGILTLTLPKAASARERRIPVHQMREQTQGSGQIQVQGQSQDQAQSQNRSDGQGQGQSH